jgi:hypothetical protein
VRTSVVVEVLPLLELLVEDFRIVDHDAVQQSIELLRIDPMGALDLAVEPGSHRLDVAMSDALVEHMPVKPAWNSEPLSVWMTSTRNGNLSSAP